MKGLTEDTLNLILVLLLLSDTIKMFSNWHNSKIKCEKQTYKNSKENLSLKTK